MTTNLPDRIAHLNCFYRLGPNPAITLATFVDLGMSDETIARYLGLDLTGLEVLLERHDIRRPPCAVAHQYGGPATKQRFASFWAWAG